MDKKTYQRFFWEGAGAYETGLSMTRCPHEPGTAEHRYWIEGWIWADQAFTAGEIEDAQPSSKDRAPPGSGIAERVKTAAVVPFGALTR